jgi:hypothetical protein
MSHQRYALTAISSYGEKFAIAGKKKLRNVWDKKWCVISAQSSICLVQILYGARELLTWCQEVSILTLALDLILCAHSFKHIPEIFIVFYVHVSESRIVYKSLTRKKCLSPD